LIATTVPPVFSAFADISLWQIALVVGVTLFASIIGGVAGYGTGALMPLVLVPMVGAETVVPIIAMASLLTNSGRTIAYLPEVDWRRVGVVLVAAVPPAMATAYGYTLLTGKGASIVIGCMLMLMVPLRHVMRRRSITLGDRGLLLSAAGFGTLAGGTVGAGVILLSVLMAAGLVGPAVIATDAFISIVMSMARVAVFGFAGAVDLKVASFALLIGLVAFPGAFLAKAMVKRMPVHVHTAILDAVVLIGGFVMVASALRG
jgi:uncharacterized membrane protein YfcA